MKYLSFLIIIIVGSLVFGVAGTIIWMNVANSHSTYRVLRAEIEEHKPFQTFQSDVNAAAPPEKPSTDLEDEAPPAQPNVTGARLRALRCQELKRWDDVNLIAYLQASGRRTSLSERRNLAEFYGFTEYRGTGPENIKLLQVVRTADMQSAHCMQ